MMPYDITTLKDSNYYGTGKGYNDITVRVNIKNSKIAYISIVSESEQFGDEALLLLSESIIAQQSFDVDTVSGATLTSNGVIDAVKNALFPESK